MSFHISPQDLLDGNVDGSTNNDPAVRLAFSSRLDAFASKVQDNQVLPLTSSVVVIKCIQSTLTKPPYVMNADGSSALL